MRVRQQCPEPPFRSTLPHYRWRRRRFSFSFADTCAAGNAHRHESCNQSNAYFLHWRSPFFTPRDALCASLCRLSRRSHERFTGSDLGAFLKGGDKVAKGCRGCGQPTTSRGGRNAGPFFPVCTVELSLETLSAKHRRGSFGPFRAPETSQFSGALQSQQFKTYGSWARGLLILLTNLFLLAVWALSLPDSCHMVTP
jgi:hypothetical protein